jgi:hypothetical protein
MRQAQAEAKREIDEYRALREAKLRSVQPEVRPRLCALAGKPATNARSPPPARSVLTTSRPPHSPPPLAPLLQAQALDEKIRRITQETNGTIGQLECVAPLCGRRVCPVAACPGTNPGARPAATAATAVAHRSCSDRSDRPPCRCRAEYNRNKEVVIAMLLQIVMQIENPYV